MLKFYKKALLLFSNLLVITCVLGYVASNMTFLHEQLLPASQQDGGFNWQSNPYSDASEGGNSSIVITDDNYSFSFDMQLLNDNREDYSPFALAEMIFLDPQKKQSSVNLSNYDSVSFHAKCSPKNILTFAVYTVDESVTTLADSRSHRISTSYFSCDESWQQLTIDLTRLDTPEWWYKWYNSELSKQDYNLDKVVKLSIGSSIQSPENTLANVSLMKMELHGKDWHYLYAFIIFAAIAWISAAIWLFKQHNKALLAEVKEKMRKDRPLVAYQQLSIEPQKNREKDALLKLMATEYANPELHLDCVVQELGINRNKVNEILKDELGLTFTSYLNKLRLNESARLLAENESISVSEIAYSVGYKNIPYFNKLFKQEYGCSPKVFKKGLERKKDPKATSN